MQRKRQDSTTSASLKNVRQQQKLETHYEEIDNQWDRQLKQFTKKRLDCTYDLTSYRENVKKFEHLPNDLTIPELKTLTTTSRIKHQKERKEKMNKYSLKQPDPVDRMPIPPIPLDIQETIKRDYQKMLEKMDRSAKKADGGGEDCDVTMKPLNRTAQISDSTDSSQSGSNSSSRRSSITKAHQHMPKLSIRRQTIAVPNSQNCGKAFSRPCDLEHCHSKLPPVHIRRGSIA